MNARLLGASAVVWLGLAPPCVQPAAAQSSGDQEGAAWRSLADGKSSAGGAAARPSARVTEGAGVLPNSHGQVWREYDIRPYTSKVSSTAKPEQAIIDWVLRETGTEVWFSSPLGLLSADREALRVYHTPEMQRLVADVVDRFVASEAESHVLGLRLVTVNSPNWRSKAHPLLRPIEAQSPGIDAWLVSKENTAVLVGELLKRTDCREHNSPNLLIHNGQSHTISRMRPRNYVRSVRLRPGAWPGHELQMGQVQEGYSLQLSPLLSADASTIDAVIKCEIDQVERFVPVPLDLPLLGGQSQRVQLQVPQIVSWRLHERFRWPAHEVLLLSCGVVATPTSERATTFGIPNPLAVGPGRADALLFVECKGRASQTLVEPQATASAPNPKYRNRY
jgi:hypothetical protein